MFNLEIKNKQKTAEIISMDKKRIKIVEGKKDKEINDFLVEKYGNFILMKPPFYSETFLLWSSPFIIVLIGFIIIFFSLKKTRSEN